MNKFTQSTSQVQAPQPPPAYSDRQFLHTSSVGVSLPLAQATVTAGMVMLGTLAVLYLFDAIDLFKLPIFLGIFTWIATWLYLQRRWLKLTSLEQILQVDINGDGRIGEKPKPAETVIRLDESKENGHYQSFTYRLKISESDLIMLADGLINRNRPLSRREWTPKAKGFSDDEYRDLQSDLLKFGLAEQQGAGFGLTRPGRAMMKHYASLSPTPIVGIVEN
jgi:hypothetical protein